LENKSKVALYFFFVAAVTAIGIFVVGGGGDGTDAENFQFTNLNWWLSRW
jgi:hypothetical protein